jgi:hypothetical protein
VAWPQVSYGVRFEGTALIQLNGLPAAAFDALLERVVVLVDQPWDAAVMPPGDDPAYRVVMFGAGYGLLSFHAGVASAVDKHEGRHGCKTSQGDVRKRTRKPGHGF